MVFFEFFNTFRFLLTILQKGDIIVAINDEKVVSMASLKYALYKYEVGDTVTVHYLRNGKKLSVKMKLTQ